MTQSTTRAVGVRLSADVSQLVASYREARKEVQALTKDLEESNKLLAADNQATKERSAAVEDLTNKAGQLGLVAAGAFAAAAGTAANFDQAVSNVAAATGETAANLGKLEEAALQAGQATAFSATEAAAAIENLAKAGVSTEDILAGALRGSLDLAAAGQLGVAEAAEYTATALTQFQLAGDQAARVADLLAAGAGKAQGEVADMANALNYAGVPASNLGVTIEETAGAIALLAKNGIIGEQAGTSLRGMLASLTSPSQVAAKEMERLGITVFDTQGQFVGFDGIADQLQARLGGLTDAERAAALGRIFGNEQLQAANVLYREGAEGVRRMTDEVQEVGFATDVAATRMDNLRGDLEKLQGALETTLIRTGDDAQGPLRALTQRATDAVDAFGGMPNELQNVALELAAITAITGGATWFGSRVIRSVAETRGALSKLSGQSVSTRQVLSGVGKGFAITGALFAISAIDDAVDGLLNSDLSGSRLQRSLEALAKGDVMGTIGDVWGNDLQGLNRDLDILDNNLARITDLPDKILPGDFSQTEQARSNIAKLDEALAALVETGERDIAVDVFEQLAKAAEQGGNSVGQLQDLLPEYGVALKNVGEESVKLAAEAANSYSTALGKVNEATAEATLTVAERIEAMQELRSAALRAEDAELNYLESILDARKAARENAKVLAENGDLLDGQRRKGIEARRALRDLAGAWNEQSTAAKNAKGAYRAAFDTLVEVAVQMGYSQTEAKKYARELMEIPEKRITEVTMKNIGKALEEVADLKARVDSLKDKSITVTVATRRIGGPAVDMDTIANNRGRGVASDRGPLTSASERGGGRGSGARPSGGGTVPSSRAMSSSFGGATVMSAPAPVSRTDGSIRLADDDLSRLAGAVAQARPLYGDIKVYGDNSLRRELARNRKVNGGGVNF